MPEANFNFLNPKFRARVANHSPESFDQTWRGARSGRNRFVKEGVFRGQEATWNKPRNWAGIASNWLKKRIEDSARGL